MANESFIEKYVFLFNFKSNLEPSHLAFVSCDKKKKNSYKNIIRSAFFKVKSQ